MSSKTKRLASSAVFSGVRLALEPSGLSCRGLLQVSLVGVVIKAEAEREKRPGELAGQRRERVGRGNAAPRRPIKRTIARSSNQPHIGNLAILGDGKLNREFPFLHLGGFRNQVIPVHPHVLQNPLQVRTKIHPLRVAQNLKRTLLPAVCPGAQAKVTFLTGTACTTGCRPLRGLLNRLARTHTPSISAERIVGASGHLQLRLLVGLELRTWRLLLSLLRLLCRRGRVGRHRLRGGLRPSRPPHSRSARRRRGECLTQFFRIKLRM